MSKIVDKTARDVFVYLRLVGYGKTNRGIEMYLSQSIGHDGVKSGRKNAPNHAHSERKKTLNGIGRCVIEGQCPMADDRLPDL